MDEIEEAGMYLRNCIYKEDLKEVIGSVPNFAELYEKALLITGASGLIASFLIDLLCYANQEMNAHIKIYALVRDKEYAAKRYQSVMYSQDFHLLVQDVCMPISLDVSVDYIIHAAGDGYPEAFKSRPVETMLPAIVGTLQLLEYARANKNVRFLYVSSGEVYGTAAKEEFVETDSGYVDSMKSRSCYPSAKRAAETLCVSYAEEYGVDTVVVRPSHIYGPNTSKKDNRASAQFFQNVARGENVVLKSDGKQMRSYTYVADCVSGLLTVLICGKAGEAYNISNSDAKVTVALFAELVAELGGVECIRHGSEKERNKSDIASSGRVLNDEKLRNLNWQGRYSVSRGIRHTLEILRIQNKRETK